MTKFNEDMSEKEKREILDQVAKDYDTSVVILENPSYATGLIGWMERNGKVRAVYSDVKMIEDLMRDNDWDCETALDWYRYNTERGCPYCYTEDAPCPLIIHEFVG